MLISRCEDMAWDSISCTSWANGYYSVVLDLVRDSKPFVELHLELTLLLGTFKYGKYEDQL